MAHTFQREALYEEVWSTPLSTLGPRYGLSDNGIRKICKVLNIPLPRAGHWAKLAAGHSVIQEPLPADAERTSFVSYPPEAREHVDPTDQIWLKDRLAFEEQPENRITVDLEPTHWHKAIAPLRKTLEAAVHKRRKAVEERDRAAAKRAKQVRPGVNLDHFKFSWLSGGLLGEPMPPCFQVSELTGTRALAIANAAFLAAEERGCVAVIISGKLSVSLNGATFLMAIRERQDFDVVDRNPIYPSFGQEKRYRPTDRLALVVSRSPLGDFKLAEDGGQRLEAQLNGLFCRLYRTVVLSRERKKEFLAEHERRLAGEARAEAVARARAMEAAARAAEAARREELIGEAARWHQAQQIRDYVKAVAAEHLDGKPAQHEKVRWGAWALSVADEICPLSTRLKSFNIEA
ncbi:hypothetical protein [Variovorax paradoxus]|uniref:Uncharacterized protein n=1 Tax=Variovorax paradoxus (strain EPS) TaxID=595537 RepID=E6V3Q4_VARPE|nr:hypothetical protein [Variovorax paradoxus]ADU36928.1 hypothetical protein Varpa_2730 [Variovorax paradoxus EPS]